MTAYIADVAELEVDDRWRQWQARGATRDRRTVALMRNVMQLVIAILMIWSVVQLTS